MSALSNTRKVVLSLLGGVLAAATLVAVFSQGNPPAPSGDPVAAKAVSDAIKIGRQGDWHRASSLLARHAVAGNPRALLEYGRLLSRGWGTQRDLEQARDYLLQAVQYDFPGRGVAAFELARVYRLSSGPDCQRIAFEWFSKSLKWGFTKAHLELGKAYRHGAGIAPDIRLAVQHYRAAVLAGSVSAAEQLLRLVHDGGPGTEADPAGAAKLFADLRPVLERAAETGDARAARTLGRIFRDGLFTEQRPTQARDWFLTSARLGDAAGMHDLAAMILRGSDPDAKQVLELLEASAERGYGGAMVALGRLHLKQRFGLRRNGALHWFELGLRAGHPGAMEELARMHAEGELVEKSLAGAIRLARRGADLKHTGSQRLLTELLAVRNGQSPTQNSGRPDKEQAS